MYIMDMECDGLRPTKIHVLSIMSLDKGIIHSTNDYDKMRKFFSNKSSTLIGHNIIRFDIPILERLLDIKIQCRLIDTLSLSWYLYPDRNRHGLGPWGQDLGVKKPEVDDWSDQPYKVYENRCEEDVKINFKLWEKLNEKLNTLYGNDTDDILDYLSFKMSCAAEQERSRWKLDEALAKKGLEELTASKEEKVEQLRAAMPKVPVTSKRTKPKKPFKKDGSLSATGEKWNTILRERSLPQDYSGVVEIITGYKEPKPTSPNQIKDWLYSLGWKPQTFKFVRNKDTGDTKQIPQINLERGGGVCPSIKKLYDKEPSLELLDGLSILSHRIPMLEGFLKAVDEEGYIKAEVQGLTNTLRFKHAVCVNLPGPSKPYGSLIRGCLTAPEGYELCGSDMKGLEDRTGMHYIWNHDPKYVRDKLSVGFDPHTDMAVSAGLMTKEEEVYFKQHKEEDDNLEIKRLDKVRAVAKAVNYASTYGAGAATIARTAGVSLKEAKALHTAYWERNWSVRAIPKTVKVKKIDDGSMWLFNPVSKFWYSLRQEKDIWSTLNQGTGVYCFDMWVKKLRNKRPQLTAQYHDEVVLTVKKGHREGCTKLLKQAIVETNEELMLNVKLDIDTKYGDSYANVH